LLSFSFVRNTAVSSSDIDLLVDLAPGVRFSLMDLVSVKDFLEDRLRLETTLRDRVLRETELIF